MATQPKLILAPLVALWCGCGNEDTSAPAADAVPSDCSVLIDAPSDGAPDASSVSMDIMTACIHICDRIYQCVGSPTSPTCVSACETNLLDCTPQQVMQVDACAQAECGDFADGIAMCLDATTCFF